MASPVSLDVLVLPAFGAEDFSLPAPMGTDELSRWLDVYDLDRELSVPGANAAVYHTDDGLGVTPTGVGKAASAGTVASLLASPALDLTDATLATVGIAGAPPSLPVGSVVVADAVVDWDLKHRFDAGDPPVRPLSYRPRDYVWEPDPGLVETAVAAAESAPLDGDDAVAEAHRKHGLGDPQPVVEAGTSVSGDEFWHGADLAEQAAWLCAAYGVGDYARTEMEDAGTAAVLERHDALDRWVSVRAVANYDRPLDAWSPDDGVEELSFDLACANAFRAGRAFVDRVRD